MPTSGLLPVNIWSVSGESSIFVKTNPAYTFLSCISILVWTFLQACGLHLVFIWAIPSGCLIYTFCLIRIFTNFSRAISLFSISNKDLGFRLGFLNPWLWWSWLICIETRIRPMTVIDIYFITLSRGQLRLLSSPTSPGTIWRTMWIILYGW